MVIVATVMYVLFILGAVQTQSKYCGYCSDYDVCSLRSRRSPAKSNTVVIVATVMYVLFILDAVQTNQILW